MTFADLQNANKGIRTTTIERKDKITGKVAGKEYAEVNERIKAFRMLYPEGFITTDVLRLEDGVCVIKAEVGCYTEDGQVKVLGTGTAYEKEGSTFINKTSYIENCETSAVGRALGMVGIGIDTSVASFEEVANAIHQQTDMSRIVLEPPVCPICGQDVKDVKCKDGSIMTASQVYEKYGMCAECKKASK